MDLRLKGAYEPCGAEGSAPVEEEPDIGGEREEGESVFEFEGPFGGFVAEKVHAEQSAGPAAEGAEQNEP